MQIASFADSYDDSVRWNDIANQQLLDYLSESGFCFILHLI